MNNTPARKSKALEIGFANESDIAAIFELLGMLAKANGVVKKVHIQAVEKFIGQHIPESERSLATSSFKKGKVIVPLAGTVSVRAFELYGFENDRWLEPMQILDLLVRVALSDGDYTKAEEYLVDSARATLGVHKRLYWTLRDTLAKRHGVQLSNDLTFAQDEVEYARATDAKTAVTNAKRTREEALKILGVSDDAQAKEIKSAYRALVKRFHPDLLEAGQARDEAVRKQAVEYFCDIQESYELLLEQKA